MLIRYGSLSLQKKKSDYDKDNPKPDEDHKTLNPYEVMQPTGVLE